MPKTRAEWIAVIAILALAMTLLTWLLYSEGLLTPRPDRRAGLPSAKDPRLVGHWRYEDEYLAREFVFQPDGNGLFGVPGSPSNPMRWGTDRGILYVRFLVADFWPRVVHPYRFSKDGAELHLERTTKSFRPFGPTLVRSADR